MRDAFLNTLKIAQYTNKNQPVNGSQLKINLAMEPATLLLSNRTHQTPFQYLNLNSGVT